MQLQNWNDILRLTHSRRLLCHIFIFYFLLGEGRLCGDCIPSVLLQTEIWRLTASGKKGTQEKEQNISKKHMKRAAEKASPCKAVAVRHWSLVTWLTWPLCNLCNQATQQFFAIKTALCVLHALPIQIFKALIKSILTYYLQNFKGPLMDWQPVRGAPHLLPKHSWDRLQPVFYVWKNLSRG